MSSRTTPTTAEIILALLHHRGPMSEAEMAQATRAHPKTLRKRLRDMEARYEIGQVGAPHPSGDMRRRGLWIYYLRDVEGQREEALARLRSEIGRRAHEAVMQALGKPQEPKQKHNQDVGRQQTSEALMRMQDTRVNLLISITRRQADEIQRRAQAQKTTLAQVVMDAITDTMGNDIQEESP